MKKRPVFTDLVKERRYTVFIYAVLITTFITGCIGKPYTGVADTIPGEEDTFSYINIDTAQVEDTEDIDEPETEDVDESESVSIDGEWIMLWNTQSAEKYGSEILEDNRQPVLQTMFIYDDNEFSLVFHNHGTIEGKFNHTGHNEYTIDSFIVINEMGVRENRNDELWLRYDPESGYLRLTSFQIEDNMYIHTHYMRTDDE